MHASLIRFPLKVLKFASNDKTHTQARSRDKEARRDSTHKPVEEVNKEKKAKDDDDRPSKSYILSASQLLWAMANTNACAANSQKPTAKANANLLPPAAAASG
jgi:hypothetical protein